MLRESPPDRLAGDKSELEIQAHWFAGDFGSSFLTATNGERVEIVQFGVWNREAGPDFTDAAVRPVTVPFWNRYSRRPLVLEMLKPQAKEKLASP